MSSRLYEKKRFVLTNTLTGKREEFRPLNPPNVTYYSCGPTVYGLLHIGNARALIVADLFYRWLKHIGYQVNFVRNYTDVDDKIILRSHEEKISASEVSEKYVKACEEDLAALGMLSPSKTVRVTESMPEIIALIQKIIDRKHAYVVNGEVLFSVRSFQGYGKLSGKNIDDLQAGARVEVDAKKRDPMDFSLWKPHKPGEPFWESPWGKGRPGWHIECSAMVFRWLGESIDVHHGGQDLIFPHHENEIAQAEAASGKPFCGHWFHHAFLTAGNEKMSKSLGNILTIREFLKRYSPEILKFIFLSFHFRSSVPYTEEMLSQALNELERIYTAKRWAQEASVEKSGSSDSNWKALLGKAASVFEQIENEMFQDMNTPGALGHLFTLIRELNRVEGIAAGKPGIKAPASPERAQVALEYLNLLEGRLKPLWAVFGEDADSVLTRIREVRMARAGSAGATGSPSSEEIEALIVERANARKNKDFKRADDIRKELEARGIALVDSPSGTTWKPL